MNEIKHGECLAQSLAWGKGVSLLHLVEMEVENSSKRAQLGTGKSQTPGELCFCIHR